MEPITIPIVYLFLTPLFLLFIHFTTRESSIVLANFI